MKVVLPRYVIAKPAAKGLQAFYFNVPMRLRRRSCPVPNEALGTSYVVACGEDGNGGRAAVLNGLLDEWDARRQGLPVSSEGTPKIGTVDWLFREYKQSKAYLEKVSVRSRVNYEWAMRAFCDLPDKAGQRTGSKSIKSISPRAADKIYDKLVAGPKGERLRTAEKLTTLARKAWKVVHRLFPAEFNNDGAEPLGWGDHENPRQADQSRSYARTSLCVRSWLFRGRRSRSGCSGGDLFRMAAAPRERNRRPHQME